MVERGDIQTIYIRDKTQSLVHRNILIIEGISFKWMAEREHVQRKNQQTQDRTLGNTTKHCLSVMDTKREGKKRTPEVMKLFTLIVFYYVYVNRS